MATIPLSITQNQTFATLRTFLLSILPSGVEVFQAQTNRVPEPEGTDFVVMTPIMRERLEWNITTFVDGYPSHPQQRIDLQPTQVTIQCDVHGPNSADNVQVISTLWFSEYSIDNFAGSGYDITPLYNNDPHQSPFLDGEQQIENRWIIDLIMQVNTQTIVSQDFANELNVNIISVDAQFPI